MRTCYYEITVRGDDGGPDCLRIGIGEQHLQRDRTYYLATNAGIVLKIAYRKEVWRIKQVAGPPARRDKANPEGWSDIIYHPGPVDAYVFGIGYGFPKPDLAERTFPGYLAARTD